MTKIFEKRRYQERAVDGFKDWSINSSDRIATIILATGLGKTRCATDCIQWLYEKDNNVKILWAAHREELVDQAADTIKESIPAANVQIELAEKKAANSSDIVVGSVQSLVRERKNLIGFVPNYIIIDEWHHYSEKNVQYHNLLERFPQAKVLGLTATPFRFSGGDLPLGRKLIEVDIGTGVRHGYLAPPKPETLKTNISLAEIHKRAGDFAIDELSSAVNVKERNELIAKRIISAIREEKRQGILFGVDVAHAKAMFQLLKNEVRAAEVYGETDKTERRLIMERARNQEIDVLVNNSVLTEGLDLPHISFICMAKPTLSLGFFCQGVGRGLRKFPGKTDCLVIDVWDKIKITQSRITYSDMNRAGDIDGSNKRAGRIIKEPIAEILNNFPVIMQLKEGEQLPIDKETWFTPSWLLTENQWVISWSKSEDRSIKDNEYDYKPLAYTPNTFGLRKNHMPVRHRFFGTGTAFDIDKLGQIMINFDDGVGLKSIDMSEVEKREPKYETRKLDVPIKRIFYICIKDNKMGRLISLLQDKKDYKVVDDIKGDKTTIDEFIKITAEHDNMTQIVKADAKWRAKPISDKQSNYVARLIGQSKLSDTIDTSTLLSGDAAILIDQVSWYGPINKLFCTDNPQKLIGYTSSTDDV